MILAEYEQIEACARYGANDIRPGLTGWAQINGRDAVTVEEKARLDGGKMPQWDDLLSDLEAAFRSRFIANEGGHEL